MAESMLDESWLRALSFLTVEELCSCARWCCKHRVLANSDELWHTLCRRRWRDKLNMPDELFRGGDYSMVTLTNAECKAILTKRGVCLNHILEKAELLQALASSTPTLIPGQPLPILGKWKTSYAFAEADSRRQRISHEEVAYFRWHLTYNGAPSTKGLRHFQKDGVFVSPHFGTTSWHLTEAAEFVMGNMDPLPVKRVADDWGWIIGDGTPTVYRSVEM